MRVPPLLLASRSPRRAQLLEQLGLAFTTIAADIDETYLRGEEPGAHVERLAREKAAVVARAHPEAIVVGSDTAVVVDGDVLGKPSDAADAVRMLMRLAGRTHEVATGVAVVHDGVTHAGTERVAVRFRAFDEDTARAYVMTGEPMDKAGAYGIQGYGAALVDGIDGDYFAVMGLPLVRLLGLLQRAGFGYNFRALTRGERTRSA